MNAISAKQLAKTNPEAARRIAEVVKPELYCVIVGSAVGNSEFIPIATLNQASAAYRAFCDENGFGARDAGSCYIYRNGNIVAHVSYNGNVWSGKRDGELLFNNTGLERQPDGGWDLSKKTLDTCSLSAIRREQTEASANEKAIAV